ncbi:MAG: tyrosine--tRNA ligase [Patescibacteria group bacterium]
MIDEITELLERSVDRIYPTREALEKELRSGKKMRVYLGVDPTGPHLHLGHATNLLLLKKFQNLGHEIIFLIGDFTAKIGDPTDKLAPRVPLSEKEIKMNLKTFKEQAEKVINFSGKNAAKVRFNSEWHKKMNFAEVISLAEHFTVQQMEERDMFEKRKNEGKAIGLNEFLYPLTQGYDSVALDTDIEIGGTDQTFNMLAGRKLMRELKHKEKFVMTTKLLENPKTGKKLMNKSEGGLINLDDEPREMFGKVMALPDEAILPVAEFSTDMVLAEMKKLGEEKNPRDAKLKLAYEVVRLYHSEKEAENAEENWIKTFSKKETPSEIPQLKLKNKEIELIDLLLQAGVLSKTEARRLILEKAVEIDSVLKTNPKEKLNLKGGEILKIGKRKFFKITF